MKKILAILLTIMLTMATLVGCGSEKTLNFMEITPITGKSGNLWMYCVSTKLQDKEIELTLTLNNGCFSTNMDEIEFTNVKEIKMRAGDKYVIQPFSLEEENQRKITGEKRPKTCHVELIVKGRKNGKIYYYSGSRLYWDEMKVNGAFAGIYKKTDGNVPEWLIDNRIHNSLF